MATALSDIEWANFVTAREYFRYIQQIVTEAHHVIDSNLQFTEVDIHECYIRGVLTLRNGPKLHAAEYSVTEPSINRLKYRYQLLSATNAMLVRWDNASHHPEIASFPHHRHDSDDTIHASPPMGLPAVLYAITPYLV